MKNDHPTSVRAAVIEIMRELGMTTLFGNPGSTELEFLHDWPQDIRYVLGLQESVVVAMADGHAQATGRAAMVNLHSAAGVGHALGSIYTAFKNQTPLVITAGQQSRGLLPYRPFLGATQATEFPRPYVKWSCEPARAEDVPLALRQAHAIAMQRPRGPVFVSIPSDDWHRDTLRVRSAPPATDGGADQAVLAGVAARLASARRVALAFGAGVARDGARARAVELAERLGADAFAAPIPSRSVFDETHPLYRGVLPAVPEPLFKILSCYDAVLVVGAPAFTLHIAGDMAGSTYLDGMMHITDDPDTAASSLADTVLIAAPGAALAGLLEMLPAAAAPRSPVAAASRAATVPDEPAAPEMTAHHVVARMAAHLPARCAVVEEAPSHKEIIQAKRMFGPDREYFAMASGGLGFALPAAVGIAASGRFDRVVCLVGDGSAMYAIQALYAAARMRLDLSFLILNNEGYGAMRAFSRLMKGSGAPGIDLPGLDFATMAQAYGLPGRTVTQASDVDAAFAESFSRSGPSLVDFRVDAGVSALYGVED
jgi:benzoylformate decarboxylase